MQPYAMVVKLRPGKVEEYNIQHAMCDCGRSMIERGPGAIKHVDQRPVRIHTGNPGDPL